MKQRKLRSLLLSPFKQTKIGFYFLGLSLAFSVITALIFLQVTYEQHIYTFQVLGIQDGSTFESLFGNSFVQSGLIKVLLILAGFFVITLLVSVVLTHRIYGPLVSIKRFLGELERGNFSARAHIREKDELHELVGQLNSLAESLEKKKRSIAD